MGAELQPGDVVSEQIAMATEVDVPPTAAEVVDGLLATAFDLIDEAQRAGLPEDPKAQEELAGLIAILPEVQALGDVALARMFVTGIAAATGPEPRLKLAGKIKDQLRDRCLGSAGGKVVTGLAVGGGLLLYVGFLLLLAVFGDSATIVGIPVYLVAAIGTMAILGSVVSMLTRIKDFNRRAFASRDSLFIEAASRPLIGLGFAFFVYVAIESGMVTVLNSPPRGQFEHTLFWMAVAFVAGFSERFGPQVVARAEGILGGADGPELAQSRATRGEGRTSTRLGHRQAVPDVGSRRDVGDVSIDHPADGGRSRDTKEASHGRSRPRSGHGQQPGADAVTPAGSKRRWRLTIRRRPAAGSDRGRDQTS